MIKYLKRFTHIACGYEAIAIIAMFLASRHIFSLDKYLGTAFNQMVAGVMVFGLAAFVIVAVAGIKQDFTKSIKWQDSLKQGAIILGFIVVNAIVMYIRYRTSLVQSVILLVMTTICLLLYPYFKIAE
ncbi:hypothetical protein SAMN05421767_12727 [Granulicatella balaenopterae]|uniref:Uncharacterized protein n=1 Tax=Granulicatella balaenopterae TaxID=137733 RepID=A0A1H9MIR3_9LACT|nr:hypothetical protein [Granulicatella balaenopterae]SER23596.1 hypothetical protein SAMN05421767_12727 [Granulicatella balaenopterae]